MYRHHGLHSDLRRVTRLRIFRHGGRAWAKVLLLPPPMKPRPLSRNRMVPYEVLLPCYNLSPPRRGGGKRTAVSAVCVYGAVCECVHVCCTSMWLVVVWWCGESWTLTKKTHGGEGRGVRVAGVEETLLYGLCLAQNQAKTVESYTDKSRQNPGVSRLYQAKSRYDVRLANRRAPGVCLLLGFSYIECTVSSPKMDHQTCIPVFFGWNLNCIG